MVLLGRCGSEEPTRRIRHRHRPHRLRTAPGHEAGRERLAGAVSGHRRDVRPHPRTRPPLRAVVRPPDRAAQLAGGIAGGRVRQADGQK